MTTTYPHIPGHRRTDTSRDAAPALSQANRLQGMILAHLADHGPATADECASALHETVLSIRPRLTELKRMGLIADTGNRRPNTSGRMAAVMQLVPCPV